MNGIRCRVGLCALAATALVQAQTAPSQYVWEEFAKRIQASEKVEPLGANFAGEQVSLSNGGLSFRHVDASLPGNDALRVEFARSYTVFNRRGYGDLGMLADWQVDVPSISAVFAPNWVVGSDGALGRCSSGETPPVTEPFTLADFWQGLQISIPGQVQAELLRRDARVQQPSDGELYRWITSEHVQVSCLDRIDNGSGEGFLARTPDGTRYWFSWMGQTDEPPLKQRTFAPGDTVGVEYWLTRKKTHLYATRVEDRFGNHVTYSYSNAWNAPGKLTKVQASDGRTLTLSYQGNTLQSVSDGSRTWTYSFGSTLSGRKTLTRVGWPDGSAWSIDLSAFTNAEIKPWAATETRACTFEDPPPNWNDKFVGKLTHPAGATAEFTLGIQEHGNSWVPLSCRNVQSRLDGARRGADNNRNDDVNLWPISSHSLTLEKKSIQGPGLVQADWTYAYEPNVSTYMYPGTTWDWPVCDWARVDCALPPCREDSCASYSVTTVNGSDGQWRRYRHGNTYRYNVGKLLGEETGSGPEAMLRRQLMRYDLSQLDSVYPARFGQSLRGSGDGFASEYHRPLIHATVEQQG